MTNQKIKKRIQRRARIRSRVFGTETRPRLSVFRSNRHVMAQLIDDAAGSTLVSASDIDIEQGKKRGKHTKKEKAGEVGMMIAERALSKKISHIVFDRGGYRYHGLIKALAEGARKGGLRF